MRADGEARARVIVVDDSAAIRDGVSCLLTAAGYDVTVAASGEAALALLATQGETTDVLLTDLRMPHLDGARLAAIVRYEYPTIRIVLMSATPDDPRYAESLRALALPVLAKAELDRHVLTTIRHILDASSPARDSGTHEKDKS